MKFIIAEAINTETVMGEKGEELYYAKALDVSSVKYITISKMLNKLPMSYFLKVGQCLSNYLKIDAPLVFVTDWTDPTELVGLRLEMNGATIDFPNLCFFAFYTDWKNISNSGIERIFAHEFSHIWMNWLGCDSSLSKSNKFHTCTSITDPYMAFLEGFAEHLEIVTKDLIGYKPSPGSFWDYGFDANAWLSSRDEQLRYHAVINNRFIYQTATPYEEDFGSYSNLHLAHITSTAFTPERLKNGSQMMSSEGVIASFFYQMYISEKLKNTYSKQWLYSCFGVNISKIDPILNLYLKIVYALTKIDLTKDSLMIDFIYSYGICFPDEKEELYNIFTKVTHFATISLEAKKVFGELYRIGRRGDMDAIRSMLKASMEMKTDLLTRVLSEELPLDTAIYKEIWIEGDKEIPPIPWMPEHTEKYRFNVNTATAIDLLSLSDLSLERAEQLVNIREAQGGFNSLEEFGLAMEILKGK